MKNTKKLIYVIIAVIMVISVTLLGACKKQAIVPESVTITGKPQETIVDFVQDGTLQLGATIEPEGAKAELEWRSNNTDVATISNTGLVTYIAPGHAVILVTIKGTEVSDSFTLSLRGEISGLAITNKPDAQVERYFGETITVNYEVSPAFVGEYNIIWTSSDEQVAVVEAGDNMSAIVTMRTKAADVTITATVEGTQISDSFDVKGSGERSYLVDFDQSNITYAVSGENVAGTMISITDQDLPVNGSGNGLKFDSGTVDVKYAGISFTFPEVFKANALYNVSYDIRILNTTKGGADVTLYTQHKSQEGSLFPSIVSGTDSYHIEGSFTGTGTNSLLVFYGIEALQVSFVIDNISIEREAIDGVSIAGRPEDDTIQMYSNILTLSLDVAPGYEAQWESSDENVATVSIDNNGNALVTLLTTGKTTIRVEIKDTGYSDSFELTVINVLEGVSIDGRPSGDTISLSQKSLSLIADIAPGFSYQWTSENTAVATINQDGLVEFVSVGDTVIKLKSGEFEDSFTLSITKVLIENKPENNEIVVIDGEWQLNADIPAGFLASWESLNTDVATISDNGLITLVSAGTTIINLNVGGGVDSFELTVLAVSFKITNKPTGTVELDVGMINTLTIKGPEEAEILWSSSDTSIADIDVNTGVITLNKAGTTTIAILATYEEVEYSDSFKLTITDFANGTYMLYDFEKDNLTFSTNWSGGTVTKTSLPNEMPEGGSGVALKFSTGASNIEYGGIAITLNNPLVAGATYEVSFKLNILSYSGTYPFNVFANFIEANNSENYVIDSLGTRILTHTLITTGNCNKITIFAQPKQQYEFTIDDVHIRRVVPTGVSILGDQETIEWSQKTLTLTASNAYGYPVVWTSSNESVATIEDGQVTLIGVGSTIVTLSIPTLELNDSFNLEVLNTMDWYPLEYLISGYDNTLIELRDGDVLLQLDYELTFSGIGNADEQNLSWAIDQGILAEKASIDNMGNLLFKQAGFTPGEEQEIVVNLLYNDLSEYHVVATVSFAVKYTAFEPLVFTLKDNMEKSYSTNEIYSIDIKDGNVVIGFEYSYTGDNFEAEKIAYDIDADLETAEITADGMATFKASSFRLIKVTLLYDGVEQTSVTFVIHDSTDEKLGKVLTDGTSIVSQATVEEAPNNLTTEAKKVNINAGADAWPAMRIYFAEDGTKFISNASYLILMDVKMLADGINQTADAKRNLFFGGISNGHVLPLPALGQTKTLSAVVIIGDADRDFITAFKNSCDYTFSVNNIRIIKLDGPASVLETTLNGIENDITGLAGNGTNMGLAAYGDNTIFANGLVGWPAFNGVLSGLTEGTTYNITFDVTMLNNSLTNGQIFFNISGDIKPVIFTAFEKQTVSLTITASTSTLFRIYNGDDNNTRCAAISCIVGPVTITEAV